MILLLSIFFFWWVFAISKVLFTKKSEGCYELHAFSINQSTGLKGILIIGIMLSHLQTFCFKPHNYPVINEFAVLAQVGMFFFISGYGLTTSYLNKGKSYLNGFLLHRLSMIIIPLIVATIIYLIEVRILPIDGVKSDTPLPFSWFCYVIIGYYIAYYVVLKITENINVTIITLLLLTILLYFVLGKCFHLGDWWYRSTCGFNLGMIVKRYEETIKKWFSRYTLLTLLFVPFGLFCIYASGHFGIDMEAYAIGFSLISLALIYTCGFTHNKVINWIGKNSYEIYLCHPMIIALYPLWPKNGICSDVTFVCCLFVLTFVMASLLHKLTFIPFKRNA